MAAVAKDLCKLLPSSKVFPISHLIALTEVASSSVHENGLLRVERLISDVVNAILAANPNNITWLLVDGPAQCPMECGSIQACRDAARQKGNPFLSVSVKWPTEDGAVNALCKSDHVQPARLTITHSQRDDDWDTDVANLMPNEASQILHDYLKNSEPSVVPLPKTFANITGFKHEFIRDLRKGRPGQEVNLICWIVGRLRHHGAVLFFPVGDSTGAIQVVVQKSKTPSWIELKTLGLESSLQVAGKLAFANGHLEIMLESASIISKSARSIHPEIRKVDNDILASHNTDRVLAYRHLYLRNPLVLSLNLYRSKFFSIIHRWFQEHKFVDISAPLITPSILYEPSSAIHLTNLRSKHTLFLSQCAGFYLEAAAHAHERVYNLGPSFRNESRTNRHLMEYWHIKAEICSGRMNDIIDLVEVFLYEISEAISLHTDEITTMLKTSKPQIKIPFQRITYIEALALINEKSKKDFALSFGQNISKPAENLLTEHFGGPVWITHKPRELEPFPYCICPEDERLTMTADLISSGGFGEICGVAEKSYTRDELECRMKEKGKLEQMDIYSWVLESRDFGMVPHTAFGMGFERVMRWFCGLPHVKDAIPFPRVFGRDPIP